MFFGFLGFCGGIFMGGYWRMWGIFMGDTGGCAGIED